jgi:hypothetical protein
MFKRPPKTPEIIKGSGMKGLGTLIRYLVELKVYKESIGEIEQEDNTTKVRLSGIAERIRDRF